MKNRVKPKVLAWRFITFMAIIIFSIAACDSGSLPSGGSGNNPVASHLPDEIRLNMASLTLLVEGKETLTATVLPADAANKSVKWSSADSKVATVDPSNGTVTAISVGKTVITATTEAGGKTATCTVSVTEEPAETVPAPTSISLFPPSLTLNIGDTDTLVVTVTPANAAKDVNWKSENPAVVVVDSNGKITAKGAGTASVYALTIAGGRQASSVITVNLPPLDVEQVNKYEARTDSSNNINDRIKYSVTYGDFDYYYIHLGSMQHIPLFFYTAQKHDGMASTYSVSKTNTTKESIEKTVTQSSQTTLGIVDTNTVSTTLGGKASVEISKKYTINVNLGGISAGSEVAAKAAVEAYWSKVNTNSSTTSSQKTTSLTDTVKNGTEYTESTVVTISWNLSKSDKIGWYRYTLFSASDVYLYVVRDRTKPNEIYYEFREHVIPDVYFWQLDYSETASFNKSDETRFGFDVSMLDKLPKPTNDIAPSFEITFNSNGGSSVPKQTVPLNGTVTRPANPTMSGYTFVGWYTDSGYKNLYDFSTKVIENITLYAKWDAVPKYTVTFNINGGSGSTPASQTVNTGTSITLPSGSGLSRSGYIFGGWNTNTSGTGTAYSAGSSYTVISNITLYVKWLPTSFREESSSNFAIKGGAERDWLITTSFDIAGLKNAGYTKVVFTLNFEAKNELLINVGSRLYATFWKGLAPSITTNYGEKYWTPALSRWESKEFIQEVNLTTFENQLTIRWGTSANASFTVGNRSITIEAKK